MSEHLAACEASEARNLSSLQAQHASVVVQLRTAMVATIYHKALRLSLAALGRVTVGNVVNLATNDSKSLGQQSRHLSIPNPWNAHTTAPPSSLARSLHFLGRPT